MKGIMFGWIIAIVAHHSLAQFDTTTAVTVKGTIVLIERVNPHSFIYLDQNGADGQVQLWAVEGPAVLQLERNGIRLETLKVGDVIEACGYVLKSEGQPRAPEALASRLKEPTSKKVRVMDGEMLVMPDGRKQRWSDYGFHKCLGADYKDFHTQR